jgi:hypothetical protein
MFIIVQIYWTTITLHHVKIVLTVALIIIEFIMGALSGYIFIGTLPPCMIQSLYRK